MADIVFILDSSGSIGQDNWLVVLDFVKQVVSRVDVGPYGAQFGLVKYGNSAFLQFNLNDHQDTASLLTAIDAVTWLDSTTNTSGGLWLARAECFTPEAGNREFADDIAILITDGASNVDAQLTIPNGFALRDAGVKVFALGVTNLVNFVELNGIAGDPSLVFRVQEFSALNTVVNTILSAAQGPCLSTIPVTQAPTTQQPQQSFTWTFDRPSPPGLQLPEGGVLSTSPSYIPGIAGDAIFFDGTTLWANLGDYTADCFGNPSLCPAGSTYAFWLRIDASSSRPNSRVYILSSGAQAGRYGWALYWENGSLYIFWATTASTWGPLQIGIRPEIWYHVTIVWRYGLGVYVYINGYAFAQITSSTSVSLPSTSNHPFIIGGDGSTQPVSALGTFSLDDFKYWNTALDDPAIRNVYTGYNWRK